MTLQEIFDKASTHLLTQNAKSLLGISMCRYRADNGLMCAVGCLIKDEFYTPDLERKVSYMKDVQTALVSSGVLDKVDTVIMSEKSRMLDRLQEIHDIRLVSEWESELKILAKQYKLNFKGI